MHFDWWTLTLQTINFVVLVWLLHRFLYAPVLSMVDARRAAVDKERAGAVADRAKAAEELAAIETARTGIAAEREAALKAAAAQAGEAALALRAQAQRDAAALVEQARKSLAAEREEAVSETRRAALDLGMDMARRLLGEVPPEVLAEAWLERIERHLAGLSPSERDELKPQPNGGGALRIVTAAALPDPAVSEWRARLHRALGDRIAFTFEVDADLLAGVELHFPNAILRFSWQSALASMRAEIEAHEDAR